jgi:hypothetical protein
MIHAGFNSAKGKTKKNTCSDNIDLNLFTIQKERIKHKRRRWKNLAFFEIQFGDVLVMMDSSGGGTSEQFSMR